MARSRTRTNGPSPVDQWLQYVTANTVRMVDYYGADVRAEGASVVDRALAAGAVGPLDLQGIGMTAWVLCDARGVAFKVSRELTPHNVGTLENEAEWLRVANTLPEVKMHVARFYRWHPELGVIVRECIRERDRDTVRRRKSESSLWDLHRAIGRAMLPYGFAAPELKADSYILTRDRGPVIVDAGFALKTGSRLAREVAQKHRDPSAGREALAFERGVMRSEYGRTIDPGIGARLEQRLADTRPNGAKKAASRTLYHTTFARNLPAIAKHGLRPSAAPMLRRGARGNIPGVYLSDAAGVPYWFGRLVDWALNDSDEPAEDGLVPVVLRVKTTCRMKRDEPGSRDSIALAVVCPRAIVPGAITVWDGQRWARVGDGVDASQGVDDEGYLLHRGPLLPRL